MDPSLIEFQFGKHKGKMLSYVIQHDAVYLFWCYMYIDHTQDTLKHWLPAQFMEEADYFREMLKTYKGDKKLVSDIKTMMKKRIDETKFITKTPKKKKDVQPPVPPEQKKEDPDPFKGDWWWV